MGRTLTRMILESHLESGTWDENDEPGIHIDQTLTQDATGTMAFLQFETMGIPRVRTELSVSYIDHNTMQIGFENADDHRYLASAARKYGVLFSRAGNGICHQTHLERFGRPGATLLGSDSHTPTAGGLGMIGIGAGGLDVALAMAGQAFHLPRPFVVGVRLEGALQPWVSAKDIVLKMLSLFGTKGNVGRVFEYYGPGVAGLSVQERATIANMGAECGVSFSLFPSDGRTQEFMRARGRADQWKPLSAEPEATYDQSITINLDELEPLVAAPHSPGNVKTVRELAGIPLDQVCIGSCTNSSFRDLAVTAAILRGTVVPPSVSLVVTPGSRQVLLEADRAGIIADFVAAGARMVEPSCSFCIGNGFSPASGAVSVRTSNRNFEGRSGTADAQVYIASPETAAASARMGRLVDPRDLGKMPDVIAEPGTIKVDDRLIVLPATEAEAAGVQIVRGPNIGAPPSVSKFPESVRGRVGIKVGDRITTDHIMPAGARMKYRSNIPAYSAFVFENVDPGFAARAALLRDQGEHVVIVAGQSYGQGSSREHAAICPGFLGVRVVLAVSFERIHAANLVNFGILPLLFVDPADYAKLAPGDRLELADSAALLKLGGTATIKNQDSGLVLEVRCELGDRERATIAAGGSLAQARSRQTQAQTQTTRSIR